MSSSSISMGMSTQRQQQRKIPADVTKQTALSAPASMAAGWFIQSRKPKQALSIAHSRSKIGAPLNHMVMHLGKRKSEVKEGIHPGQALDLAFEVTNGGGDGEVEVHGAVQVARVVQVHVHAHGRVRLLRRLHLRRIPGLQRLMLRIRQVALQRPPNCLLGCSSNSSPAFM